MVHNLVYNVMDDNNYIIEGTIPRGHFEHSTLTGINSHGYIYYSIIQVTWHCIYTLYSYWENCNFSDIIQIMQIDIIMMNK